MTISPVNILMWRVVNLNFLPVSLSVCVSPQRLGVSLHLVSFQISGDTPAGALERILKQADLPIRGLKRTTINLHLLPFSPSFMMRPCVFKTFILLHINN